jgi:tellurite resistance protein
MPEFFPEIEINDAEADAIARGLYAVARADGQVHIREAQLISDFFSSTTDRVSDLGALERDRDIEPAALAAALPGVELRKLFLKTALLLAFVDGEKAPKEEKLLHAYAAALGVKDEELHGLEGQVKDFLLSHLSHLQNTEAAAQVARELKI